MLCARTVLVPLTITAVVTFSGCSKTKPNAEIRLPGSAYGHPAESGDQLAGAPNPGSPWGPDGAPSADGALEGFGSSLVAGAEIDPDSGGLMQNASTDGIESGIEVADLEMVHFDYDRAEIKPDWQRILDGHADWLTSNPSVNVQVEGHCDERGTEEYNISLGQRRADAVREYLVSKGVEPTRVSTISYGKLRPLTFDQSEEANSLNRRAMFLVYTPESDTMTAGTW